MRARRAGDQNVVQVQAPPRSRQSCKAPVVEDGGQDPPHIGATVGGAVFPHGAGVLAQAQLAGITPVEVLFGGVNLQASSAGHAPPQNAAVCTAPGTKPHGGAGSFAAGAQMRSALPSGIVRAANWSSTPTLLGALLVVQVME